MVRRSDVQYWGGISTYLILVQLEQMEQRIMATLDQAKTDADALVTLVQSLIDAFNAAKAGTLTAEQQASVDAIEADIQTVTAAVDAANPPGPTA